MKQALVILVLLLLLGCQLGTAGQSSSQGKGDMLPELTEVVQLDEQLLQDYVRVYEDHCGGRPFSAGKRISNEQMGYFLFGWLEKNGGLERYAVYDGQRPAYYSFPLREAAELAQAFFGRLDGEGVPEGLVQVGLDELKGGGNTQVELSAKSGEWLPNGNYRLTVERSVTGRSWRSAEYVFAPVLLEQEPGGMLGTVFGKGDTLYRLVSLRNLSAPAAEQSGEMVYISNARELAALAKQVNSGDWSYQNNAYKLVADINMFGVTMEPIGSYRAVDVRDPAPTGFCSIFDGQGHTISNLTIRTDQGSAGFFSLVGRNGQVSNLRLENCEISNQADADDQATGGLAGLLYGAVNNCSVSGRVSGNNRVGGLFGAVHNGATVWNSKTDATVSGSYYIGGLAGEARGSQFYSCTARGAVYGSGWAIGGFIGNCEESTIDRGIVSVQVTAERAASSVGYFSGMSSGATLVGCFYNVDAVSSYPPDGSAQPGKHPAPLDLSGLSSEQLREMGVL